ncbi:MAG: hypothetical protein AMJ81_07125 [Phycisphaerae bacterium SM23_33]|nr:MAG: hypothetical protein AMJ81_07125 [Phycisphaerae bacterium SM23_33]
MPISMCQIDAFTAEPFAGNPAAVCVLPAPADAAWMQRLAAEMNLSETAFLLAEVEGWRVRWFTPATEVDLCGHATLASAHLLWEAGLLPPAAPARFHTRSGLLTAERRDGWIELNFPASPPEAAEPPPALLEALKVRAVRAARTAWFWLVEVEGPDLVRDLQPDFERLRAAAGSAIVTSRGDARPFHFVSRFFAPAIGINEDPVTGAAHCCLGPYWGERLGRTEMTAFQASRRGGVVRVRLAGERVYLAGQAVTVFRGELSRAAGPGLKEPQ